jgi:transcriptional regulator with XRE-family HTH domain
VDYSQKSTGKVIFMLIGKAIGKRIRKVRKDRDMLLTTLAKRVHRCHSHLSKIEHGKAKVSKATLIALAKELRSNFGETWLDEHLSSVKTRKNILKDASFQEIVSLKFGGEKEARTPDEVRILAKILDDEIAKYDSIRRQPKYEFEELNNGGNNGNKR